ncbi:MAG: FeS cluster assembly protein sufB [Candidatus Hodgkinia cicadicola]|nr:MAG: FeS cluster assembly protein sufB [Candidatus Hodgkinia cicadicola]
MLAWRINAYYCVLFAVSPRWACVDLSALEFNALSLINVGACARQCASVKLTDIDVVCDASSVYLQISKELKAFGVRFTSISKALLIWAVSVRRYMGSVVAHNDNYFSMLNSCLFTDGTYVSVPAGVSCPASLSTYFRMSSECAGQLERTLVIANCGSDVVYFEGCNAVKLAKSVVHAAVVELVLKRGASLKYTTLQNWFVTDRLGVYNLVTKRALCGGAHSRIVWVQVEIGARATWKYPSSVLLAQHARSEFYSLSVSNRLQRVDTGTKVFHLAKHTASTVLAKSVLFGKCYNFFRALISLSARNCRNYTRCDALVASADCVNRAIPIISVEAFPAKLEYESLSSYVTASQLSYCKQRGIDLLSALKLVVIGHSYEVTKRLPLDVSLEVARLLFVN